MLLSNILQSDPNIHLNYPCHYYEVGACIGWLKIISKTFPTRCVAMYFQCYFPPMSLRKIYLNIHENYILILEWTITKIIQITKKYAVWFLNHTSITVKLKGQHYSVLDITSSSTIDLKWCAADLNDRLWHHGT